MRTVACVKWHGSGTFFNRAAAVLARIAWRSSALVAPHTPSTSVESASARQRERTGQRVQIRFATAVLISSSRNHKAPRLDTTRERASHSPRLDGAHGVTDEVGASLLASESVDGARRDPGRAPD
jgi:hypothetical protein